LAKKLGITDGCRVVALRAPDDYLDLLAPLPSGVAFEKRLSKSVDLIHIFSTRSIDLERELARIRNGMRADATVWVSWPKKASKVPTDITEDTIRALALPIGLVDIKVCAVSETWSGLKLVIRKELRERSACVSKR
jgi:hypothetical protein